MATKDYNTVINKATDATLNTYHIATDLANYEAARTGFFMFMPASSTDQVLSLIAQKANSFSKDGNGYTASNVQDYLRLNVTKVKVPHFSVEPLKYQRGNETVIFAGKPTFDSGSFTIDDIVGIDTKSLIEAWLELTYDLNSRTGGRMYEYKMDCNLVEYTQDYRPIRTWLLSGCFISTYSESDFDKTADGKREISVTLQYDRATMVRGLGPSKGFVSDVDKVSK